MTIQQLLKSLNIPAQYGTFDEMVDPPFIVYMGMMPDNYYFDNIPYVKQQAYRLEYYFKDKNESLEDSLEDLLASEGWTYTKSDDLFISQENLYAVYYYIERMQNYGN